MENPSKSEVELREATGLEPSDGEGRYEWLTRLARAVNSKLPDDKWELLSDESQIWVNGVIEVFKAKGKVIKDFDGTEVKPGGELRDGPADSNSQNEEGTTMASKNATTKKPAAKKPAAEKKAKARTNGVGHEDKRVGQVLALLIRKPDLSLSGLVEASTAKSIEGSPAMFRMIRRGFRQTVRALSAAGKLKEELALGTEAAAEEAGAE